MSTLASVIIRDVIGNLPAFGVPGRLFFASDTGAQLYDTGSAWVSIAPAGGGAGIVLVEAHTAASSATLDFTTAITSTYDEYLIEISALLPATNSVTPYLRVSTDGGATYDSGANYSYQTYRFVSGGAAAGGGTGQGLIDLAASPSVLGNGSAGGLSGSVRLYNATSATVWKRFVGQMTWTEDSGARVSAVMGAAHESVTAINALRIAMSSGNIASGTVHVYGLAK